MNYGVDIYISGDAHHYERFAPQNLRLEKEPTRGIRQFVVGTGGATFNNVGTRWKNTKARNTGTWGVLKLTLHSDSYSWHFVPVKGKTFTDVGFAPCVTNAPSAMP
jgi:acid phosphatase type 7